MSIAITLHLLAAIIWVGGMFFAYVALRPVAAALLDPPLRLRLWSATFKRFFPWVWISILLLPATGYWMIFAELGGFGAIGRHIHIMHGLGWIMIGIYLHMFFAPYRRLNHAIAQQDWPLAGKALASIRKLIALNLSLGLAVAVIAAYGRYYW